MSDNKEVVTSSAHDIGCVKWFNNKSGFGFITVSTGEHKGTDIFVHHTGINVSNEQYKYLVQGEYVELSIELSDNDKYKYKAVNVSGISGGKLMCETRHLFKQDRQQGESSNVRRQLNGPRESKKEWSVVSNSSKKYNKSSSVSNDMSL